MCMQRMKATPRTGALIALIAALSLALALLAACGRASSSSSDAVSNAATTRSIEDMAGRTVEIPAEVDEVVGIGASSLRLVCYLGAVDTVVGVEQSEQEDFVTCSYRHVNIETFSKLPVIGDGGSKGTTPNEEAIAALAPDVVIANVDKDTADALQERTGVPVVCITITDAVFSQGFYDNVKFVGAVLGREKRAAEIEQYMKDVQADLQKRTADVAGSVSAYAAGISYRGGHGFDGTEAGFPPFAACNVVNIADEGVSKDGPYTIDLERVSAAQPDVVFVEGGNLPLVKEDVAANPAYFDSISAVQKGEVHSLIAYRFYMTNVELALANCYQVGAVVYPDRFADVDPLSKLDEISAFFLGRGVASDLAGAGYVFGKVDLAS